MSHAPVLMFRLPNRRDEYGSMQTERLVSCECIGGSVAKEIQELWDSYRTGCAGLNPGAYKECVEALRAITARINGEFDNPALNKYGMLELDSLESIKRITEQALAHAQGQP